MARENVELVQRAFDAFNRRDWDAFLAVMDPDVEAAAFLAAMEGNYHGHDGIRRWWENLLDSFPDFTIKADAVRDHGDLTVSVLRYRGHGAGSDTPVEQGLWHLAEWREGKCVWWGSYGTEAEALEAAGLRE